MKDVFLVISKRFQIYSSVYHVVMSQLRWITYRRKVKKGSDNTVCSAKASGKELEKEGKKLATIGSKMIGNEKDVDHPIKVCRQVEDKYRYKRSLLMVMVSTIDMQLW